MEGGWTQRKKILIEFGLHVKPAEERSLRDFKGGDDAEARANGHGKTAMVFHMLKILAGDKIYARIVDGQRENQSRSWDEVRSLFEKELGRDLGWFFEQWVDRKGLPALSVENAAIRRNGSKFEISFDLKQNSDIYILDVPVDVLFMGGSSRTEVIRLDSEKKQVSLLFDDEPSALVIDRNYDIPRRLLQGEIPPLLPAILKEDAPVVVLPDANAEMYTDAAAGWKRRGGEEKKADAIKDAVIRSSSFVLFGADNALAGRLFGKIEQRTEPLALEARKNPWNPSKVVLMLQATSAERAAESIRIMAQAGEFSTISLDAQGKMIKTVAEADRGILIELRAEPAAVQVSAGRSLSEVIEGAAGKQIVYVGEYHDRFSHHNIQLQVIKAMHRKYPKIAIGMEMFQRPFQKALDEYISGAISERDFLKQAQYFKRWSFDYNLYKPILDFARFEKIPVVALNIRREITDKVSKAGMDALTDEERKELPALMDFSDAEYRVRLGQVFSQHRAPSERSFESFYQAQILWDETMAQTIDEYVRKNPESRMVVVAGLGHIAYGSGIPKRAYKRNGRSYAVILNDVEIEPGIADYLVYPQQLDGYSAPRIMASLKESGGRVSIEDFLEGSAAKKAGIKSGDVLLSLDSVPVETVDDVKIALFYKKKEDVVRFRVQRTRFLLGETELEFEVKLP